MANKSEIQKQSFLLIAMRQAEIQEKHPELTDAQAKAQAIDELIKEAQQEEQKLKEEQKK